MRPSKPRADKRGRHSVGRDIIQAFMSASPKTASVSRHNLRQELPAWIPVFFLLFVFLLGGSSRSDIASLPLLRGGVLLFAFWAASGIKAEGWRRIRVPLVLLSLLTAWIATQLIPLPADVWHGLAGRDTIASIDQMLGQADIARPISLTPSQTWNALLAMTVPFAALLVAARTAAEDYPRLLMAIVVIACLSGVLGFWQVASGVGSAAYFYRITNSDSMVGLFANRNHHAVFLACAVIVAAMLLRDELMRRQQRGLVRGGLAFAAVTLTAFTALIGSRAGLAAGAVAFIVGYAIVVPAWRAREIGVRDARRRPRATTPSLYGNWFVYLAPLLLTALLATAYLTSDRATGLRRFVGEDVAGDLRVRAWPTVQQMIETHGLFGAGFGSFPDVFKMFEPDNLLNPSYFNHAHNDWAELLVTGGLPFALVVAAALIWFGRRVMALGTRNLVKGYRGDIRLPVITIVIILAIASAVDYPLRIPSLQAVAIMLIAFLCAAAPARSRPD